MKLSVFILVFFSTVGAALAEGTDQPYTGFQDRDITSLSEADIEELSRGGGWGLALPAELNGYPGPAHLLELKDQLELNADQVAAIKAIFGAMRQEAVKAGKSLIEAESELDRAFNEGSITRDKLRNLIVSAEAARAELRFVHLSRHLMTIEVLTRNQIEEYAMLRGYADDPCAQVPEGHNEAMWRRHNGCSE